MLQSFFLLNLFHIPLFSNVNNRLYSSNSSTDNLELEPEGDKQKKDKIELIVDPHTPVKIYSDALASKPNIIKDFKKVSLIYMWFNKDTGRVYIGSAIDGSRRLATYYQPSILKNKSLIYQSILKYGHESFLSLF